MKKKNREINIFSMSALDLFASAMGAFLLIAVMALPYYLKVDPDLIEQIKQLKTEIVQNETKIASLKAELKKCREDGAKALKEAQAKIETLQKENEELKKALAQAQQEVRQAQQIAQTAQAQAREAREQVQQAQQQAQQAQARADGLQKKLSKTFCVVKMQWESATPLDVDLHIIDYAGNEYSYSKQVYSGIDASLTVDAGVPTKVKQGAEVWVSKQLKEGKYTIFYKHYSGDSSAKVTGSVFTKSFTKDLPTVTLNKNEKRVIAKIKVDSEGKATLETN